MTITLVHLSDLHFTNVWHENEGKVFGEFIADLSRQIARRDVFVVFTGDILQAGENAETYKLFSDKFLAKLSSIGIGKERLIFLPGNHDVDRAYTKNNLQLLRPLQHSDITEKKFNETIYTQLSKILYPKFAKFVDWQKDNSDFALCENTYCGKGFSLSKRVGIYALNTALYSFGGERDEHGDIISDERSLLVETRHISEWLNATPHDFRILAMHHPSSWLKDWARTEIDNLSKRYFDLVLYGHVHEAEAFNHFSAVGSTITCVAPALFTDKDDPRLGYSIIEIDVEGGKSSISYRHWVGTHFVTGTALSKTENGKVVFGQPSSSPSKNRDLETEKLYEAVEKSLENALEECLRCYASLPATWIDPKLANVSEHTTSKDPAIIENTAGVCEKLRDLVIKAPPQFGLSSLGRQIALKIWRNSPGEYVAFFEAGQLRNHQAAVEKSIEQALQGRGLTIRDNLKGIIIDNADNASERLVASLKKAFPTIPLVLLVTVENPEDLERPSKIADHAHDTLYLWSFDKADMRLLVQAFIKAGNTLDENSAVEHLVSDLTNLNLHRTAMNCLTLLTVYQSQVDYSPSNRTEMLDKFLYLIFNAYKKNPDYGTFPDLKDSYYVLGDFCEKIIRMNAPQFTKANFISVATTYCNTKALDIDVARLFQIMVDENILCFRIDQYSFRYTQWIFFFAAHRMHHSEEFRNYILSESRYINYPHMIEFYSGIDRRRNELIDILTNDLRRLNDSYENRTNIISEFDPYETATWEPTSAEISSLKVEIERELGQTKLPSTVKDQIADVTYDRSRPYVQQINNFLNDASLRECLLVMRAASRALRNSDHVEPEKKSAILAEIVRAWAKLGQTIAILSPFFARDRKIRFENLFYYLGKGYENAEGQELWMLIMNSIPQNIVRFYEEDFSSARIRPLLERYLKSSTNTLGKHFLISALIRQRPKGWITPVKEYLYGLDKNSFYLWEGLETLSRERDTGYCTSEQIADIETLMGIAIAKHEFGAAKPGPKMIANAKELLVPNKKLE